MTANPFDTAAATWDDNPHRVRLMRTLGEAIVREAAVTPEMDVLDYGCGTGLLGLFLLDHAASVTGADNSPGMLDVLRGKIAADGLEAMSVLLLDLERDAVPDRRFDLVVVGMALHHIADVDRVLRAFHTMLRPGGTLCIADLDPEGGAFHDAEADAALIDLTYTRDTTSGEEGLDLIARIRAFDATTPIVAMTGGGGSR